MSLEFFLKRALDAAGHAVYITDTSGSIIYANQSFADITGFEISEILGENPRILKSGLQSASYYEKLWDVLVKGAVWKEEIRNKKKNGVIYCASQTISPIRDPEGRLEGYIAIQIDISAQKLVERNLSESEARYKSVVSAMKEGVILKDSSGRILAANHSAELIMRMPLTEVEGRTSYDEIWGAIREDGLPFPGDEHPSMVSLRTGKPVDDVVMGLRYSSGETYWVSINSRPIFLGDEAAPSQVLTTFSDITEQKRRTEEITTLSETDSLTGLFNRRAFMRQLFKETARSKRHNFPISILMMDFDHFKNINDTYGHSSGDAVLTISISAIGKTLRAGDLLCRWGGEELLLMAPYTNQTQGLQLAERIRKLISELREGLPCQVTLSLGLTTIMDSAGQGMEAYIEQADQALYKAKKSGRNKVEVFSA